MAQRRMISLKIVDTDYFLDMPVSTQNLYFHLLLRADDDGFVSSPKKILKMVNGSDDDYKVLIAKQLLLKFDSGVCVIRHWRIHNCIQADRRTATMYSAEKASVTCVDGVYQSNENVSKMDPKWIQNGSKMDTQYSIGKDSIDKNSINKNKYITTKPTKTSFCVYVEIKKYTQNAELQQALCSYADYRKKVKKPLTAYSLKLLLNKLKDLQDNDKIQAVEEAILKGWLSFYPSGKEKDKSVVAGIW